MAGAFRDIERAFLAVIAMRDETGKSVYDEATVLRLCGGDQAVAAEVRSLLRHFDTLGQSGASATQIHFLDPAGWKGASEEVTSRQGPIDDWGTFHPGQRLNGFTLIEQRGAGGMGVVFLADQDQPRRTVALKLVRQQAATPGLIRRFEREAQLLARLNHPGIAQIYAAGAADVETRDGTVAARRVPYIAMELVDGPDLLEYVITQHPGTQTVVKLIAQICDAVQHAHTRGVIHRDLKPSNILVIPASAGGNEPQVKVLDFGVARYQGDEHGEPTIAATAHGQIVGTLAYMSPEQVTSEPDVDARSDVYSIGVILYRLLAGRLPVDIRDCPLPEAARRIVEQDPPALGSIDRSLRGDIGTITATAMQKEPGRRYQSPAELARDLRHYLAGEPVQARRDSLVYILRKRVARYRTVAWSAAALLLVVTAAALYARHQQRLSAVAARTAIVAESAAASARDDAERAASRLAMELSASRIDQGRLLGAAGDLAGAEQLLWDEYLADPNNRTARWGLWQLYAMSGCLRTISAHPHDCFAIAMTQDGTRFATGGDEPTVRLWSAPDARKLAEIDTGLKAVYAIDFSPDAKHLAVAGEGGAVIINTETSHRQSLPVQSAAHGIDLSPNDLAVAVGCDDGTIDLFDPGTSRELGLIPPARSAVPVRAVRFNPTSTQLAASYADGTVRLYNVALSSATTTAAVITPGPNIAGRPGTAGYGADFSPDGTLLATGSGDRTLTLWRTSDGSAVATIPTNNGSPRSGAFSPDGKTLAVPGFWRTQLYDLSTREPIHRPGLPAFGSGGSYAAAFSPDGRLLITTGPAGTCRIWNLRADPTITFPSTPSPIRELAMTYLGGQPAIVTVQSDGEVHIRSFSAENWTDLLHCNTGKGSQTLAISPDAIRLTVGRADGHLLTLDAKDGRILQVLAAHAESVNVARLAPDGRTLVTGGSDDVLKLWRLRPDDNGWDPGPIALVGGDVVGAAVHPGARSVAITARPGQLQFFSLPALESVGRVDVPEMPWRLAYSADGHTLAAGSWDRTVQVWRVDPSSATPATRIAAFTGHTQLVLNESFDESGQLLASVSNDGSLKLWDLAGMTDAGDAEHAENVHLLQRRRRCLVTLDAGAGDSLAVSFLPGGKSVAVGYLDGTLRIWDLTFFDRHIAGNLDYQRSLRQTQKAAGASLPTRPAAASP